MALKVTKTAVWAAEIADQPGGLAACLDALANAGASLECLIARRQPDKTGSGVAFVAPLKGKKVQAAALNAGFQMTTSIATLKVEGGDRPGLGARIAHAVAGANVNMRGASGMTVGRKLVAYLAFDSDADATAAAKAIRKIK